FTASPETLPHRIIDCCWYVISRLPEPAEFPDVIEHNGRFVIERDGQIVAEAWSSQDGYRAAEVEVKTHSDYRRRGYGRQVVAAWAHHVRRAGKRAFYSHLVANDASRALAKSVGAEWFANTREFFPKS
ncbi:MAG TPA: GNAT family N-acetyltransferase, partial [Nitrolancea sp.]